MSQPIDLETRLSWDAYQKACKHRAQDVCSTYLPPEIASIVTGYADDRTSQIQRLVNVTMWGINELWEPAHSLLREMIRCEHHLEGEASEGGKPLWEQRELEPRLAALSEGSKVAKRYLERNLPVGFGKMTDACLEEATYILTHPHQVADLPIIRSMPLRDIASLLVHVTNFGSQKLKDQWLAAIQTAAASAQLRHQNLLAKSADAQQPKSQRVSITGAELLSHIEAGYEMPLEALVDLLRDELTDRLLPHLTDLEQLAQKAEEAIERYSLFLLGGPSAYRRASNNTGAEVETFRALLAAAEKSPTDGTYLLIGQSEGEMSPARYTHAVESAHPLASIAFDALSTQRWQLDDFYRNKRQSHTASIQGEDAVLIPTLYPWHPLPKFHQSEAVQMIAAVANPLMKDYLEKAHEVANALIQTGLKRLRERYENYPREFLRERIVPLMQLSNHYQNALLYTILAGVKKERAHYQPGWLWGSTTLHPSHFHTEFTDLFFKELIHFVADVAKEHGIKALRQGNTICLLDTGAHAVIAAKKTFKKMEQSFAAKAGAKK